MVGLTELYYAGSHGMDIMGPVGVTASIDYHGCVKLTDRQVFEDLLENVCIDSPGGINFMLMV